MKSKTVETDHLRELNPFKVIAAAANAIFVYKSS